MIRRIRALRNSIFLVIPFNTLFHERRTGRDRRDKTAPQPTDRTAANPASPGDDSRPERRARKDRRRRIDPTTFDKQYTDDEMEFMNAMQRFKESSGKSFPTYREVLRVARRPRLSPRDRRARRRLD